MSVHPPNYCSVCGALTDSKEYFCLFHQLFYFLSTEDVGAHGYTRYIAAFKMSRNQCCDPSRRNPPKKVWLFDAGCWWTACGQCCMLIFGLLGHLCKSRGIKMHPGLPQSPTLEKRTHRRQELPAATIFHPVPAAVLMFACTFLMSNVVSLKLETNRSTINLA